jgi:general secretion pathway protein M
MALQERLDALQPRERRLLALFVGLFAVICVLIIPIGVSAMLSERRTENDQLRETLDRLFAERDEIMDRQSRNQRVLSRYKTPAPPLAGFLDKSAKSLEIEIPEFKDKPPVPIGKEYEERSTEITFKKTKMRATVQFMEKVAQASFPVSITRLSIRKRGTEPDSWDVAMTVSAYHRTVVEKPADKPADKKTAAEDSE